MFHIRTEVAVEFGAQVSRFGWCECREIVKYIFTLIFIQQALGTQDENEHTCWSLPGPDTSSTDPKSELVSTDKYERSNSLRMSDSAV